MENKIIRKFPLEELNLILGGIKEKTVYSFQLIISKIAGKDESKELFKDGFVSYLNANDIILDLFSKLAMSFGTNKKMTQYYLSIIIKLQKM